MDQISAGCSTAAATSVPEQVVEAIVVIDVGCLFVSVLKCIECCIRTQSSVLIQMYHEDLRLGRFKDVPGTPGQPHVATGVEEWSRVDRHVSITCSVADDLTTVRPLVVGCIRIQCRAGQQANGRTLTSIDGVVEIEQTIVVNDIWSPDVVPIVSGNALRAQDGVPFVRTGLP